MVTPLGDAKFLVLDALKEKKRNDLTPPCLSAFDKSRIRKCLKSGIQIH